MLCKTRGIFVAEHEEQVRNVLKHDRPPSILIRHINSLAVDRELDSAAKPELQTGGCDDDVRVQGRSRLELNGLLYDILYFVGNDVCFV